MLSIDVEGLTFRVSTDATKTIRWSDLQEVYIQTTDKGPVLEDVFFVLVTEEGTWKVPQGMAGTDVLLTQLQQLPGFDNEAVIRAMASADNAVFPCWKGSSRGLEAVGPIGVRFPCYPHTPGSR